LPTFPFHQRGKKKSPGIVEKEVLEGER